MSKTKKNSRRKRLLRDRKEELPIYYSEAEEILTFAYDFEDDADESYREQVQIAIEQFNALNFAMLFYRRIRETSLNPNCAINEMALRKEHLNQIVFSQDIFDSPLILATASYISTVSELRNTLQEYLNETLTSFSAFAWITVNVQHPKRQFQPISAT